MNRDGNKHLRQFTDNVTSWIVETNIEGDGLVDDPFAKGDGTSDLSR